MGNGATDNYIKLLIYSSRPQKSLFPTMSFRKITACRICGNPVLDEIIDLGQQAMTGVFPRSARQKVDLAPLELVKCRETGRDDACGLVQLRHSVSLAKMYGANYGYRSSLNKSMVAHLQRKVQKIVDTVNPKKGDLVVDIGSNDSTTLRGYPERGLTLVGIDPTGKKFKSYYPAHVRLIPDFFSAKLVKKAYGSKKAKVVTSIAMFYDLESPTDFMRQIHEILADDGVWVLEQSYLPAMLDMNAYDTICHEHLEYYGLKQIKWMADRVGFKIVDLELNAVNGGSFSLTMAKSESPYQEASALIDTLLHVEDRKGLSTLRPFVDFKQRVLSYREELRTFVRQMRSHGKKVFGYGASTKGNVILQYCGLTKRDIPYIAEVNADKFGCVTPGTGIPIVSEAEARAMKPDYFLVLPWHFKEGIVQREREFLLSGGKLVFPLPTLEVYSN